MQVNRFQLIFGACEMDDVLHQALCQPLPTKIRVYNDAFHIANYLHIFSRWKHQFNFACRCACYFSEENEGVLVCGGINRAEVLFHLPVNIACWRRAKTIKKLDQRDILRCSKTNHQRRCWLLIKHTYSS